MNMISRKSWKNLAKIGKEVSRLSCSHQNPRVHSGCLVTFLYHPFQSKVAQLDEEVKRKGSPALQSKLERNQEKLQQASATAQSAQCLRPFFVC